MATNHVFIGYTNKQNSERPHIPKPTIGLQKALFSIYFSLRRIFLVDNLGPKENFNATYFVEQVLPEIDSFFEIQIIKVSPPKRRSTGASLHGMDKMRSEMLLNLLFFKTQKLNGSIEI